MNYFSIFAQVEYFLFKKLSLAVLYASARSWGPHFILRLTKILLFQN